MATWSKLPAQLDLSFMGGDTVPLSITVKSQTESPPGSGIYVTGSAVDLTNCTVAAQIRTTTDASSVAASFTVVNADSLTTDGVINLLLSAADSNSLMPLKKLVWDLQITYPDDTVTTTVAGAVTVAADVTRLS